MLKKILVWIFLGIVFLFNSYADAEVYSWVDEKGVRHFSDSPTANIQNSDIKYKKEINDTHAPDSGQKEYYSIDPTNVDNKAKEFAHLWHDDIIRKTLQDGDKRHIYLTGKSTGNHAAVYRYSSSLHGKTGRNDIKMRLIIRIEFLDKGIKKNKNNTTNVSIALCSVSFEKWPEGFFDPPNSDIMYRFLEKTGPGRWNNSKVPGCRR